MTTVAVGNVQNRPPMPQVWVEQDIDALFVYGLVVLACEIGLRRYKRAFAAAAEASGRRVFHLDTKVPVAVPAGWGRTYGERHRLTRGLLGVNPARFFNAVFYPRRRVVYVSTHFTNGAWNHKSKFMKAWRRRAWLKQQARAARLVDLWHRDGWRVVIGGDMNRLEPPEFHPDQQVIVSSGLMHLLVVPADNREVPARGRMRIKRRSDHKYLRARIG